MMRKQLSLLWTIFGLIGLVHPACQSVGVNDRNLKIQPMNVTFGLPSASDLSADQLSMIRNWGGCQVIIGPSTTIAITPPSQCVSGQTNDFTVQVSSSRNDLTTAFIHQVVGQDNKVLVAKQSSTTLAVPNGTGSVKHQLWYKECLVKETTFNGCNI